MQPISIHSVRLLFVRKKTAALFLGICLLFAVRGLAADERSYPSEGLLGRKDVFPIAVWLQSPKNAERYRAAGINLYVGLWRGPNEEQLEMLRKANMSVICGQNGYALAHKDDPTIVAWMHGDEPDNAQSLGQGKGYGPPIKPEVIQANYARLRAADPSRPVLLNLGQAVAWDHYIGRGVRTNHPEDYPEYIKGCDIASFDIYPAVHDHRDIAGRLEYVAHGVERLRAWSPNRKRVWNCIECTHISNPKAKATPAQIRAEVWMSIIHGSRGLIYFVHQFKPTFNEAALLDDPETLAAVTKINSEVQSLASVINAPEAASGKLLQVSSTEEVPVATMFRESGGTNYLFTVCMRDKATTAKFKVPGLGNSKIEVLGEGRQIDAKEGEFTAEYAPYEVHLYRFSQKKG